MSRVPLTTLFGSAFEIPATETLFGPRVIFDARSKRFIAAAASINSRNNNQYQYLAVSTNADAEAFHLYRIILSQHGILFCKGAAADIWDYPSVGVSDTRIFITANDFDAPSFLAVAGAILDIEKAPMLAGGETQIRCFNNLPPHLQAPLVAGKSTRAVFLSPGATGHGNVIWRRDLISTGALDSDTLSSKPYFVIADWTAPPDALQNNGQRVDASDGRFQSGHMQLGNRIFQTHAVNVAGRSKIRWYRLRFTESASVVEKTFTLQTRPDDFLFNPSIAAVSGAAGETAFITASRTIPTTANREGFPAHVQFHGPNDDASGWVFDVAGTSTSQVLTIDGVLPSNEHPSRESCRWGRSATSIDPVGAGDAAWGFNQLMDGDTQFDWFTKAGKTTH